MSTRGFWSLHDVSNARLVAGLKELAQKDGWTEARIVAHLAELDARRLHLRQGKSLFEYCQTDLGLSENQAYYRIAAARLARKFPIVFELLERRELHITALPLLGKYLTSENHLELLREARGLSRRELLQALARRAPLPDMPSRMRKLRGSAGIFRAGPTGALEPLSEENYRLQLNISRALLEKLELARDLMSHANRAGDLAVVVERAVDLLIEKLQKRRFGQTSRPQRGHRDDRAPIRQAPLEKAATPQPATAQSATAQPSAQEPIGAELSHGRAQPTTPPQPADPERSKSTGARRRAHIPNATRRELVERDGLRCSYTGPDGHRCSARGFLQIHHEHAWAKGGPDTPDNLRLLCARHNRLLAEREYGAQYVGRAIEQKVGPPPQAPARRIEM